MVLLGGGAVYYERGNPVKGFSNYNQPGVVLNPLGPPVRVPFKCVPASSVVRAFLPARLATRQVRDHRNSYGAVRGFESLSKVAHVSTLSEFARALRFSFFFITLNPRVE